MTITLWTVTAYRGEEFDHACLGEIYTSRKEACEVKEQLAKANEDYEFDIMEHRIEVDA